MDLISIIYELSIPQLSHYILLFLIKFKIGFESCFQECLNLGNFNNIEESFQKTFQSSRAFWFYLENIQKAFAHHMRWLLLKINIEVN